MAHLDEQPVHSITLYCGDVTMAHLGEQPVTEENAEAVERVHHLRQVGPPLGRRQLGERVRLLAPRAARARVHERLGQQLDREEHLRG